MKCKIFKYKHKSTVLLLIPDSASIDDISPEVRNQFGGLEKVGELDLNKIKKIPLADKIFGSKKEKIVSNIRDHGFHIQEVSKDQLSKIGISLGAGILGAVLMGPALGLLLGGGTGLYYLLTDKELWKG